VNPPAEEDAADEFYDDEERDADAPNPDLQCDMKLPEPFEFDEELQNAPSEEEDNVDMADEPGKPDPPK